MHPKTLYRVVVGSTESRFGYYVIANDAQEAYDKLKKYLDNNDIYSEDARKLKTIEALGEESGAEIFE